MNILATLLIAGALLSASAASLDENLSADGNLTLEQAIAILKNDNLEIKAADYDLQSAHADANIADGYHWGKLDFTQDVIRSDNPGNVFGFKLSSREATFGDFGFDQFLAPMAQTLEAMNQGTLPAGFTEDMSGLLDIAPDKLNYPDDYTFYQSKLSYEVPIFVGGKLSAYSSIRESMEKIKGLDKQAVIDEKLYQIRKSYYDMALLESSLNYFTTILNNIKTLENITVNMLEEGYAKNTDLLEVQAKRANVERMIHEMNSNKELLYHFISFLLNREIVSIATLDEDVPMCQNNDKQILENNIDLKKAAKGLEITDEMVTVSFAGFLPQVGAFAELSTADNSFLGNANDHKAYTVGARLTWNLFNGGIDYNSYEKAKVEHLKMQTQAKLAQKGIALKLHQLRTQIRQHDHEIESLDKEVELATQIYINYEGRYREHLVSMSDVIIKQSEQIEKILALLMAKNKRNERVFALQRLANGDEL